MLKNVAGGITLAPQQEAVKKNLKMSFSALFSNKLRACTAIVALKRGQLLCPDVSGMKVEVPDTKLAFSLKYRCRL